MLMANKRAFARLALMLFGRAFDAYELQFVYVGTGQFDKRSVDIIDATGPDGNRMRLSVDSTTHLPAVLTYMAPQAYAVSTSARMTIQGGKVTSVVPESGLPIAVPVDPTLIEHRLVPSKFKVEGGVNWPHRLTDFIGKDVSSETDFGKYRLNPKLDTKRFDIR